jgi:hypothetical protein
MIDYNLVLYIGIGLIVFGFVLFLVSAHFEREAEIKLFKLKQLEESFNKAKEKEIKTWTTTDTSGDTTIWVGRK